MVFKESSLAVSIYILVTNHECTSSFCVAPKAQHIIFHVDSCLLTTAAHASWSKNNSLPSLMTIDKAKEEFRIGELNPGLVGTDHLSMIESDKS